MVVDPAKLYGVLKSLETDKDREKATERDKEIDADIEKLIVPNMQGEIAAALLSLKPVFDGAEWPAMALALKLKNGDLAAALRAGKLFANFRRAPNATALGDPVVAMGEDGGRAVRRRDRRLFPARRQRRDAPVVRSQREVLFFARFRAFV